MMKASLVKASEFLSNFMLKSSVKSQKSLEQQFSGLLKHYVANQNTPIAITHHKWNLVL